MGNENGTMAEGSAAPAATGINGGAQRTVKGMIIGETLGKGTFGYVKLGTHRASGQKFAMKFLKRNTPKFDEAVVQKEIDCMKKVRHDNVVWLVGSRLSVKYPKPDGSFEPTVLMVMEFCDAGDLYDVIYYAGALNERLGRTYFRQIVAGLQAIHNAGITHRDLKPNNILIGQNYQLKITDFGLSHIGDEEQDPSEKRMNTVWVGTKGYRAPELVLGRHYSNQADVFALGVCVFVILCARQPFKTAAASDAWYKCIAAKQFKKYWKSHKNSTLSPEAKDLLQRLLCYQPRERITLAESLEHPWMKGEDYNAEQLKQVMSSLHAKSCQKKMADPSRQARLQLSEAGNKTTRAINPDDPNVRFKKVEVPVVDRVSPGWACYELKVDPKNPPAFVMEEGLRWAESQKGTVEIEKEQFSALVTMAGVDEALGNFRTSFNVRIVKRKNAKKAFLHISQKDFDAFKAGFSGDSECQMDAEGKVLKSTAARFPVGSKVVRVNGAPFSAEAFSGVTDVADATFTVEQDEALVLCMWLNKTAKGENKLDIRGAKCFDDFFGSVQGFCAGPFVEAFEAETREYPDNLAELLADCFEEAEMNENILPSKKAEEEVEQAVPVLPEV